MCFLLLFTVTPDPTTLPSQQLNLKNALLRKASIKIRNIISNFISNCIRGCLVLETCLYMNVETFIRIQGNQLHRNRKCTRRFKEQTLQGDSSLREIRHYLVPHTSTVLSSIIFTGFLFWLNCFSHEPFTSYM